MQIRAVMMAGGSGTRLRPLTCELPKPMVPILDRPIAEHIINLLKRHQIEEIIMTLHYLPEAIQQYFGDGSDFGVQIHYAIEADRPLGTAGCIKNVSELLGGTFLAIGGDSLTDIDLTKAIEFHRQKQAKVTIVLTRIPHPIDFGVAIIDEKQRILKFLEKPTASEVFSDTVNTGIYIIEPEVLNYLPPDTEADFSQDLFPRLLADGVPMYGYLAETGYWCDIGQLDTYRSAHADALDGKVQLDWPYIEQSPQIWIGNNTFIDPTAQIEGPTTIGANCKIGAGVKIGGESSIGNNTIVATNADIKRSIVGSGCFVGEDATLRACILARGVRVGRGAQVLEGAVVGGLCNVGEESKILPNVRIWPNKEIEPLATVNRNLIWGQTAHRNLFAQRGVQGLANIEIDPEFAVKLGAAYGSTLRVGTQVTVSRDRRNVSRMISRSLMSGLMSVGINVQDLEGTAIPVARKVVRILQERREKVATLGGIHVRLHPEKPEHISIEFFDARGINISKAQEKKIESAFFREDLRRCRIADIGGTNNFSQAVDNYNAAFEEQLDTETLRRGQTKVVIDYIYAVADAILPPLLAKFGCPPPVVLNASLSQVSLEPQERLQLLDQLGHVVTAVKASFGVQVSAHGEQLILVDEEGIPIRGEMLTALMVRLVLADRPGGTVVVPVQVSSAIEQLARRYGGKVKRTKANPTAIMEACCNPKYNVVLGGSGDLGFIFPDFHPGFDAMFCIAKLMEMLVRHHRTLSNLRADLPKVFYKAQSLRCPWTAKGGLMRHILETHQSDLLDTTDGVKIITSYQEDRWVLILPDAGEPIVHIYVNGPDRSWVDDTLREYRQEVQEFIENYRLDRGVRSD
jgi:mannose-1-phosphate guanylyltransferase / phosphomannomutase